MSRATGIITPAIVLLALCGSALSVAAQSSAQLPEGAVQVPGEGGAWVAAPPALPSDARMMVLEGDPRREGMFTMRLMLPAGTRLQPHTHPQAERVTIFSGVTRVGFGDTFDESAMTSFGAGSFYINPAGARHYVWVVEETVMQLTGMGPWEIHYLPGGPD